jgi:salicylate hydroxylase
VAIALADGGHEVIVLESAPAITYIGAGELTAVLAMSRTISAEILPGIQVSSNSSRVLRQFGIEKHILPYCTEPIDLRMMRWDNGQMLVECPLKEPALKEYGTPYYHIHRADLHRGLVARAEEIGIKIRLDSRVLDVQPEVPSVTVKGGENIKADLVVASDGLHSICREIVIGYKSPPQPTGQMVYRVTLPAKRLEGIPELEEIIRVPRNNHWIGPRATILSYLLEGINETLVNFVFT